MTNAFLFLARETPDDPSSTISREWVLVCESPTAEPIRLAPTNYAPNIRLAVGFRFLQCVQHRQTDVARNDRSQSGRATHRPRHCGDGRFAIGAGYADHFWFLSRYFALFPRKELDVPNEIFAFSDRPRDGRITRGPSNGHARACHNEFGVAKEGMGAVAKPGAGNDLDCGMSGA